jgi:hypothetical protein
MSKPDFEAHLLETYKRLVNNCCDLGMASHKLSDCGALYKIASEAYRLGQMSRIDWPSEDQIHQAVCEHTAYNSEFAEGFESACEWLRSRVTGEGEK